MNTPQTQTADPIVLSSAKWFWWIAALSLVNTILFYSGSSLNFVVGLGMTSLASAYFAENLPIALTLVTLTIGFYFGIGFLAQKAKLWAFYAGLGLYLIDAIVYVNYEDWMPVAFHAFVIYSVFKGILRIRQIGTPATSPL